MIGHLEGFLSNIRFLEAFGSIFSTAPGAAGARLPDLIDRTQKSRRSPVTQPTNGAYLNSTLVPEFYGVNLRKLLSGIGILCLCLLLFPVLSGIARSYWNTVSWLVQCLIVLIGAPVAFLILVRLSLGNRAYRYVARWLTDGVTRLLYRCIR